MLNKKKNSRSNAYQQIFRELQLDTEVFARLFENEDGDKRKVTWSQEFNTLNDQLASRICDLMSSGLTVKQREVVKLTLDGYTQMEIAKMLGRNQSSVVKSLQGNVDYGKDSKFKGKHYGGTFKKMIAKIKEDQIIKDICCSMVNCDDVMFKMKNEIKLDFYPVNRMVNINLFYLIGTLFADHDKYLQWMHQPVVEVNKIIVLSKKCSKCQKHKLIDQFPKSKNKKDGFNIYCKECCNQKVKKSKMQKLNITVKKCVRCGQNKSFDMFSKDSRNKDKLCLYCKECHRKYYLQKVGK